MFHAIPSCRDCRELDRDSREVVALARGVFDGETWKNLVAYMVDPKPNRVEDQPVVKNTHTKKKNKTNAQKKDLQPDKVHRFEQNTIFVPMDVLCTIFKYPTESASGF